MSVTVEFREDRKKFQVTYYLLGKRKRPLFDSKTEADNFARRVKLGIAEIRDTSITADEAGKAYFARVSERKSKKSRCNDKRYINLHFHFMTYERGIDRLGSVELEDMEAFRDWLLVQKEYDGKALNMGPSTVNRCLAVMKHFYKRHVQWKNISDSPCTYLEFLSSEQKARRAMSLDQYLLALNKAETWVKVVLQFSFLTGAPPVCIERMVWDDVDFQGRTFSVLRKKGAKAKPKRTMLPMIDDVFALLMALRNTTSEVNGPVFRDDRGMPLVADRISKASNRVIRAAGVEGVTLYGLRHALASDLTAANVATELVRQAMIHSSITTTQLYANKSGMTSLVNAIESVRGGSLVAVAQKRLRMRGGQK